MDRSFGASTMVHTPSPLDRRLANPTTRSSYPDLSASSYATPGRPSLASSSTALAPTTAARNVRFTNASTPPSQQGSAPNAQPGVSSSGRSLFANSPKQNSYTSPYTSSAPPTRLQSTSPTNGRVLPITPSSASSSSIAKLSYAASAPIASAGRVVAPLQKAVPKLVSKAVVQPLKSHTKTAPPLGRGEAARRLRVNSVLLVAWWVSSRTNFYGFVSGHLVQAVPSLDTPLHLLESILLITLCFNVADSMRRLNSLSSLPATAALHPSTSSTPSSPSPLTPTHSSPKTRPSPARVSSAPSTPTFRSSSLSSPTPPSPQTPSSIHRSASAALRRSFAPTSGSPISGSPLGGSPLGRSVSGGGDGGVLGAYRARHSPVASKLAIDSQDSIDRLFE